MKKVTLYTDQAGKELVQQGLAFDFLESNYTVDAVDVFGIKEGDTLYSFEMDAEEVHNKTELLHNGTVDYFCCEDPSLVTIEWKEEVKTK